MKTRQSFILALILCLICCFSCACGGNSSVGSSSEDTDLPEISPDVMMENLGRKLDSANYVINSNEYLVTNVFSPEQVIFYYYDEGYDDTAFLTLNGETFKASLGEDTVREVSYYSVGDAVSSAGSSLPNDWIRISDGNLFNLFYNNVDDPMQFISYDDNVKSTLLRLAGYGNGALSLTHEVYMTLDAEDPETVHFTAVVDDNPAARIYNDDLDLTLRFGAAVSEPRVESWLSSPVFPAARTAWNDDDLFFLNSVFLPGYGANAVPFPEFASYAMTVDEEVFNNYEKFYVTDAHGTEKDLEDYIAVLLANGFTEEKETDEDGSEVTVYRRMLREDYRCYVSVYPSYEDGFALLAERWYDNPAYDNLTDINGVIEAYGYAPLPESDKISDWKAEDTAAERSESWLYFFDYDLSLYVTVRYENAEDIEAYLNDYAEKLTEKGFHPVYSNGGETLDQYSSANGFTTFRYNLNEDNTATLLFRNEKNLAAKDAADRIKAAGFPDITLQGDYSCRDIARYHKMTRGFKGQIYLAVSQPFDSAEKAEAFLDEYTASLEKAGFERTNPVMIGSLKQNAYYNESEDKYFAFDLFTDENGAAVYYDVVSN